MSKDTESDSKGGGEEIGDEAGRWGDDAIDAITGTPSSDSDDSDDDSDSDDDK